MAKTLAEELISWERKFGYNPTEAAEAAGIPRSTWIRFKTQSGSIPKGNNLIRLSKALDMSVEDVINLAAGESEPKKDPQVNDEG